MGDNGGLSVLDIVLQVRGGKLCNIQDDILQMGEAATFARRTFFSTTDATGSWSSFFAKTVVVAVALVSIVADELTIATLTLPAFGHVRFKEVDASFAVGKFPCIFHLLWSWNFG